MADEQLYFSIKTKAAESVEKILNREQNIELEGINVLEELLVPGKIVFIVLGGDKPKWETGLIGIGVLAKGPYDQGYSGKNFKVQVSMKLRLQHPIKRADLVPYKDTYGTIGIAPITKWEPNQALSQVPREKAVALFRAMLEIDSSIENDLDSLIGKELMSEVKAAATKMVEVPTMFGESERQAMDRYFRNGLNTSEKDIVNKEIQLKTCLEVSREPRTEKIHPLNFIVYGAPGTGKTYSMVEYALAIADHIPIDEFRANYTDRKANVTRYKEFVKAGQIVFTTFHQNYGYEEFIQGLRPDKESGTMSFKTVDGVFKTIADTALNDTENKNYIIIIDEINRANISKVFGELITLIEEDKRWGELNEISAVLQSGDPFAVPNNLYIVGTMNSADKSISLIDAALRRRFDFIEQKPDLNLIADSTLKRILENINLSLVQELDSSDLLVGHSYFMNKTEKDLCSILNHNIIPLLYEYFYDNRKKVANLMNEAIRKAGARIEIVDEKVGRLRVKEI